MDTVLLDTDILNEVLKQKNITVVRNAVRYFDLHGSFELSAMSRYEILRGLLERGASAQLGRFHDFCSHSTILPISADVLDLAAKLWVEGRRNGLQPSDADLLIAATAIVADRILATGNTSHFEWIPEIRLVDWRSETPNSEAP